MIARALDRVRGAVRSPAALREAWIERRGGHAVEVGHRPHLLAAIDWICRAQDVVGGRGIARGYGLVWDEYFRGRGWQPAYPETTGYIIPTLFSAAAFLSRPDLAARADAAARWETEIQLPSGGVRGGVMGQAPPHAVVFNTGQVILGWLAAYERTGADAYADAVRRAASWLVSVLDGDGHWRRDNSTFAHSEATLYNARTAWALAEAGSRLEIPAYREAGARALRAVAQLQRPNGWIPLCCLTDPDAPLLHTMAYAVRGLLEGGRLLEDGRLIAGAARAAERIAAMVGPDGAMPGRLDPEWRPAADWNCLTGQAQMANIWLRLHAITGDAKWLTPVPVVLRFLKSTQNRDTSDPGLRGGIKGSFPLSGEYGRYQTLSWAAKFFVDALIRHQRVLGGDARRNPDGDLLA
jgi:uncharacterized protein YyaL (SSP411 family)